MRLICKLVQAESETVSHVLPQNMNCSISQQHTAYLDETYGSGQHCNKRLKEDLDVLHRHNYVQEP